MGYSGKGLDEYMAILIYLGEFAESEKHKCNFTKFSSS